jgi:hypothetical protein
MFVMFDEVMMCATLRLSMVKIGVDKAAIRECFDTTGVQVHIRVYITRARDRPKHTIGA